MNLRTATRWVTQNSSDSHLSIQPCMEKDLPSSYGVDVVVCVCFEVLAVCTTQNDT